jgi:BirA family transcriptional regulator, biotin operon repressor / biotin---[acetyl-CoA-carboxylase] ligase
VSGRWHIERHEQLGSTMTRARELAEAGAPAGTVVVAEHQTEGRGTRGRVWLAPAGTCLMFTLIARPALIPTDLEHLPRLVSASVAEALLEELGLRCVVKEPNDILAGDRKLCGVLCTSHITGERVEWVLCGIGLNTRMAPDELPLPTATSLLIEGVQVPPHEELLEIVLRRLEWLTE